MAIRAQISSGTNKYVADVTKRNGFTGVTAFTEELRDFTTTGKPYLNADFGNAMNQNGAFSGNPEHAHDGTDILLADSGTTDGAATNKLIESGQNFNTTVKVGMTVKNTTDTTYALVTAVDSDTQLTLDADIMTSGEAYTVGAYWTGSNVVGAKGTFDSTDQANNGTKSVKIDNPNTNDIWQFLKDSDLTVSTYTALTFAIYVDKDWSPSESIEVYGYDSGTALEVGSRVAIEDYVNVFTFDVWQNVVIPLTDLGLISGTIDTVRMQMVGVKTGKNPKIYIDDMRFEETGTPITFTARPDSGTKIHITQFVFSWVDVGTGGTAYAYNKFGALPALANGITLSTASRGDNIFTANLKTLGDFRVVGAKSDKIDDGLNTATYATVSFNETQPIILDARDLDESVITISDDLTGLLEFKAFARGKIENIT